MAGANGRCIALLVLGILIGGFAVALVSVPETASAYTVHDPIVINGNADFTPANGVVGGTGTLLDPFVISGWEMEIFMVTGITITGTDAYFVIRDIYLYNTNGTSSFGISLWDVDNGRVENASLIGLDNGIEMDVSAKISIVDCEMQTNGYGVCMIESTQIEVTECNFSGLNYFGVGIFDCTQVKVTNSNITDLGIGINLHGCSGVEISNNTIARNWNTGLNIDSCTGIGVHNNTFTSDGVTLQGTMVSHYDSHDITLDNLVNGKPLYYIRNQADVSFDGDSVGQLIVADSTRVSIWNLAIDDTDTGIQVAYSSIVWVYYCQLSQCPGDGMRAVESDLITVTGCTISDTMSGGGLHFIGCSNLYLDGNKILDSGSGVSLESSHQAYVLNNVIQNQSGWIHYSYGVAMWESSNVSLNLNTIEGYDIGVLGYYSAYYSPLDRYVWLYNSSISNCTEGVRFEHSAHVSIADNVVAECGDGIKLDACAEVKVVRNTISDNSKGLTVLAVGSYMVEVYHNNFINNTVQASDSASYDPWDNGYPYGGNYWSDYAGVDLMYGPGQNLSGSDSIGDTPRTVSGTVVDNYPLMLPYPTNRPPVATFVVTPVTSDVSTIFSFDASASWDYETSPASVEVRWDWESDGTWDTDWSTDMTATHQFLTPGTYNVTLEVRDSNGTVSSTTREVVVTEFIPEFGALVLPMMIALVVVVLMSRLARRGRKTT